MKQARERPIRSLHLSPTSFVNASRVLKTTESLLNAGVVDDVLILAVRAGRLPAEERLGDRRRIVRIARPWSVSVRGTPGRVLQVLVWSARCLIAAMRYSPTVVSCHSLSTLPLAVSVRVLSHARLVYETHELETESVGSRGVRRTFARLLERFLIRFVDSTVVVNESIAKWYREAYGIQRLFVVRNMPRLATTNHATAKRLKSRLGIADDGILFLYHGLVARNRGIERLLAVFTGLPDRHLLVLGDGELADDVRAASLRTPNIHYLAAVAPEAVIGHAMAADVGVMVSDGDSLSYYLALPNKVFEYLHAGLPAVVSDFPEYQRLAEATGALWLVEPEAEALSRLIGSLTPEMIDERARLAAGSRKEFNWERDEPELFRAYAAALRGGRTASRGG